MSRRACLLETSDVPEYIKEIAKRLHPVLMEFVDEEGSWWGYTFRLDAKWKCGYESQLKNDCEKLVHWAKGWYAYARVIEYKFWQTNVEPSSIYDRRGSGYHYRKALREGYRNHAFLVLSDPVAFRFEKDHFYR